MTLRAEANLQLAKGELEDAVATVAVKEALLDEASIDLDRTTIRAPIDGVIVGRNVDLGQTVAASLEAPKLFVIAQDLRQMEVHAKVDEADIGRIRQGQSVRFTVDSYPGRTFNGTVVQIRKSPEEVQNVVIYTVVISAENQDLALLPGMTASATIVVNFSHAVLKARCRGTLHPIDGGNRHLKVWRRWHQQRQRQGLTGSRLDASGHRKTRPSAHTRWE